MILFAPNPTGSGHNMRALSIGQAIKKIDQSVKVCVALASLQETFRPLYEESGINVIDIAGRSVDYTKKSNLSKVLDWGNYIGGYISNAFMSGERVLFYLSMIEEMKPKVIVSDYNMAACMAAIFSEVPLVFVTERYDFTLCQSSDEELEDGGFEVNSSDLRRARIALHRQFYWMIKNAQIILTDKPYIESLDAGTPLEWALKGGSAHFVGPMIREPNIGNELQARIDLGIGDYPYLIASISGTTMFEKNKKQILNAYIETYRILKKDRPELKMILLGRGDIEAGDGIISVPYYPNWMVLLKGAELLMSAPGWITATEISSLNIPTIFILPSNSEYHEVEALRRLRVLGFPTFEGCDANKLADLVSTEIRKDRKSDDYYMPHAKMASPDWRGAERAADMVLGLANRSHDYHCDNEDYGYVM